MVRRIGWLMALLALIAAVAPARAQSQEAARAAEWIRTQQQADGSFAGLGISSTADAVFALAAAGLKVDDVASGGKNAQAFIEANVAEIAAKPGVAAKFVIAELVSGHNPRAVAGTDLVAAVKAGYNADTGVYGPDVTTHALALVALVAAGEPVPARAVEALIGFQLDDGSWSFTGDRTPKGGDTNTTALAVQALVAVGESKSGAALTKAVAYLETQRNADGGFPYSQESSFGTASDANSTALVIQAIVAAGGSPTSAPWADANGNPLSALLKLQNASGAFGYDAATPDDNAFATYQAVPALLLKPLPLEGIAIILPVPDATPTAAPVPGGSQPAPPAELPNTGSNGVTGALWAAIGAAALLGLGLRLRRQSA